MHSTPFAGCHPPAAIEGEILFQLSSQKAWRFGRRSPPPPPISNVTPPKKRVEGVTLRVKTVCSRGRVGLRTVYVSYIFMLNDPEREQRQASFNSWSFVDFMKLCSGRAFFHYVRSTFMRVARAKGLSARRRKGGIIGLWLL